MSFQKAIQDKYGFMPGLTTVDGKIRDWPYDEPKPAAKELRELKVEGKKDSLKQEVKRLASKKILRKIPMWKQMNLASRMAMLKHKGGTRTAKEKAEIASIKEQWEFIEDVRAYSNNLESEIDNNVSNLDIRTGWPKGG